MGKLRKFAYIFRGDGFKAEKTVMNSGEFIAIIVGVSKIEEAREVARELVKDGVELIDLCGAFGYEGAKAVSDAIDGAIRVAFVNEEIPIQK